MELSQHLMPSTSPPSHPTIPPRNPASSFVLYCALFCSFHFGRRKLSAREKPWMFCQYECSSKSWKYICLCKYTYSIISKCEHVFSSPDETKELFRRRSNRFYLNDLKPPSPSLCCLLSCCVCAQSMFEQKLATWRPPVLFPRINTPVQVKLLKCFNPQIGTINLLVFRQYSSAARSHTIPSWVHDAYCERVCAAAPAKLNKYVMWEQSN